MKDGLYLVSPIIGVPLYVHTSLFDEESAALGQICNGLVLMMSVSRRMEKKPKL
jgi:hypothetical protein